MVSFPDRLRAAMNARSRRAELVAAGVVALALLLLLSDQLARIAAIGPGLSRTADPFSEANAIRAAQHYAEHGFLRDAGLPHIVYGPRFPESGWVRILALSPLPGGVYTRYPPLPDLLCGLYEVVLGAEHRARWRMVPVALTLLALAGAYTQLRKVIAPANAALLVVLLAVIPATRDFMHGLHFQGYAHALFSFQLALLARWILEGAPLSRGRAALLFALAVLHGFLSFEYLFVLTLAPVAVALAASVPGDRVRWPAVARMSGWTSLGFVTAHALHFAQVIAFYRGVAPALADFRGRAEFRFAGPSRTSYASKVVDALEVYVEQLFSPEKYRHFGPYLPLLTVAALLVLLASLRDRRALVRGFGALVAAYAACFLWLFAMPAHAGFHTHIVPRIFLLAYFVLGLTLVLRIRGAPR